MAKDITIAVTGQNPDGTLNVRQVGGDTGNPFAQSTTAMVPYGQNTGIAAPSQSGGFKARIGNSEVTFASEADFLKADRELRDMMGQTGGAPALGAPRLGGTLGGLQPFLRTGADAATAVGGILAAFLGKRRFFIRQLEEGQGRRTTLGNRLIIVRPGLAGMAAGGRFVVRERDVGRITGICHSALIWLGFSLCARAGL